MSSENPTSPNVSNETMDTESNSGPTKRRFVDIHGKERSKRARTNDKDINKDAKEKVFGLIIFMVEVILIEAHLTWDAIRCFHLGCKIVRQISSLHNAYRQYLNGEREPGVVKKYGKVYTNYIKSEITVKYPGSSFTLSAEKMFAIYKNKVSLEFGQSEEWVGTMCQIVSLLELPGARMDDLIYTPAGIFYDKDSEIRFSDFGVSSGMKTMCVGARWPLSVRNSLISSLGPATLLCLLSKDTDVKYQSKFIRAIGNTFSMVPGIEKIATLIGSSTEIHPSIVHSLLAIGQFTGTRDKQKFSLPLCMFIDATTVIQKTPEGSMTLAFSPEKAKTFDFSNIKFWWTYKNLNTGCKFYTAEKDLAAQLLTHCIFGSYVEDFAVLSHVFEKSGWVKRDDISAERLAPFKKNFSPVVGNQGIMVLPIKAKRYAKATSAQTVGMGEGREKAVMKSKSVFAGKRTVVFTKEMLVSSEKIVSLGNDMESIGQGLKDLLMQLQRQYANTLEASGGNVDWRELASLKGPEQSDHGKEDKSEPPKEINETYWS